MTRTVLPTLALLVAGLGVACGEDSAPSGEPSDPRSSPSASPTTPSPEDPLTSPVVDDLFAVASDGRRLQLTCWGEGAPTVVLEAGHPDGAGTVDFGGTVFARSLAEDHRVCAYDRAGWGGSDPAPRRPRTADDVVRDLRALLRAAEVEPPYVLVGSSFGGMTVAHYAAEFAADVTGVVLLDVPAPSPTLSPRDIPEIAWDHPANAEHVDVAPEFENRFAQDPPTFEAPLVVVTATGGQSDVADQQVWLRSSPDAEQVELEGGHEIYLDDPSGCVEAVHQVALAR